MRVGVVGFGSLGQHLVDFILTQGHLHDLELAFVWNRNKDKLVEIAADKIVTDLKDVSKWNPDLIVEVAHPDITKDFGETFVSVCDYFIGSPTAFADKGVEILLRKAAVTFKRGIYIPSGAFWGAQDLKKMADCGSLKSLKVTMKKHPSAFRLVGELKALNDTVKNDPVVLYDGPVRDLCKIAPNNVNTMAAASIAAHNLGFDEVIGQIVSDPNLLNWHVIEIETKGKPMANGNCFSVSTSRKNPASPGKVTGSATYNAFCASILLARNCGAGVHMC